jgi:hypothetical protein
VASSLSLVKHLVNDNGGTAVPADWTLTAEGPTTISGEGGVSSKGSLPAGVYKLSESGGREGYSSGTWTCSGGTQSGDQITVREGDAVTCTIASDDRAPGLTLTGKLAGGSSDSQGGASWTVAADGPTPISGVGSVSSGAAFSAGTYSLLDSGPPDGYASRTWGCTDGVVVDAADRIRLVPGESSICTVYYQDYTDIIQGMLDKGGRVHIAAGRYRVSKPLVFDSRTRIEGDGNGTVIIGDFDGPILASRNYWDSASRMEPAGHVYVTDLSILGGNDGAKQNNHGLVLRDFYSTIANVTVRDVGGHGIYLTASRRDGSTGDRDLVENRLINVVVRGSRRTSFLLGERHGPRLTDGYVYGAVSHARHAIDSHLEVGSASGWRIIDFFGYGNAQTRDAVVLAGGSRTNVRGLHVQNFSRRGLYLTDAGNAIFLEAISIDSDANNSGAHGIYADRGVGQTPVVYLKGLSITKDTGSNPIAWAYMGEGVRLVAPGGIALHGNARNLVTGLAGGGSIALIRDDLVRYAFQGD